MSNDVSNAKQRFFRERLPPLKVIEENPTSDQISTYRTGKGIELNKPENFHRPGKEISPQLSSAHSESPQGSLVESSSNREGAENRVQQSVNPNNANGQSSNLVRAKRSAPYSHVQSRIDTGLVRTENFTRNQFETHQLEPTRLFNWKNLQNDLHFDVHVRTYASRLKFNDSNSFSGQLKILIDLVKSKVKNYISNNSGANNERYKIVLHSTVFQLNNSGLYVASRCLWNPTTDNSITVRLQAVDCDVLLVIFIVYTDLGRV